MALNLAWPRSEEYGDGALRWTAFIFIGALLVIGLGWFFAQGRHQLGCLPEHQAKQLAADPTLPGSRSHELEPAGRRSVRLRRRR